MSNRTSSETLPGIWAANASTNLSSPAVGTSYRNDSVTPAIIENGQSFASKVDFSVINQILNVSTLLLKQLEIQGILSWYSGQSYNIGALVMASDNQIYTSLQNSNSNKDPVSNPAWWKLFNDTTSSASESSAGILSISSEAESQVLTNLANNTKALTPLAHNKSLQGTNQSCTANGYQKLPGGLIMQWGRYSSNLSHNNIAAITFPIVFPTGVLNIQATAGDTGTGTFNGAASIIVNNGVYTITNTRFYVIASNDTIAGFYWFAVGY